MPDKIDESPLPPLARAWRPALVGLPLIGAGAWLALGAWDQAHGDVWAYNGFAVPVDVRVADDTLTLAPRQARRVGSYPLGAIAVGATPAGWRIPLEQAELTLGGEMGDTVLYNIAGRASLLRGQVVYGGGRPPDDVPLGTPRFLDLEGVEYVLWDPPASKQVRDGHSVVEEVVWNAEDEATLTLAALYTQAMIGDEDAWRMVAAQLAVEPGDREAQAIALGLRAVGDPALLAVADQARRGNPEDVEAHRFYQSSVPEEGLEALRAEYAALVHEHADSPMYAYLAGRLEPDGSPQAEALFRQALTLDPDYGYAHLALGYQLAATGRLAEALASYERYAAGGDGPFEAVLRQRVRLLGILGAPGWQEAASALLDEAVGRAEQPLGAIALRAAFEARHGTVEAALAGLERDVERRFDEPTEAASAHIVGELGALLAAGDQERVAALLATLDPQSHGMTVAKGALFLALASGDTQAQAAVLDAWGELLTMPGSNLALLAAAVARAVDHPAAEDLCQAARTARRVGEVGPAVVLEAGADLGSVVALDALLAPVPLDVRGFGYAAAAILTADDPDPTVHQHARAQAARLALPDEVPAS